MEKGSTEATIWWDQTVDGRGCPDDVEHWLRCGLPYSGRPLRLQAWAQHVHRDRDFFGKFLWDPSYIDKTLISRSSWRFCSYITSAITNPSTIAV